jgi:putative membrane protein
MNRTAATLISIGISAALIAAGVWILYDRNAGLWAGSGRGLMGGYGMMGGNGMGIVVGLFWIMLFIAIALLISGVVAGIRHPHARGPAGSDALEILKQRYARGDIDKAEFERRRRDLGP